MARNKKALIRPGDHPKAAYTAPAQERDGQVLVHGGSLYSGPIPPPEDLARYEAIMPGAAERLIAMAENEQSLRVSNQNEFWADTARRRRYTLGHAFSLVLLSGVAIVWGAPEWATAIVALALAGAYLNRDPIRQSRNKP